MKRLSIDITNQQADGLRKHVPHGTRKIMFQAIIDDLLRLCEKHGSAVVIGALMTRAISIKDVSKLDLEK